MYDVYEALFEQWDHEVLGGLWNCYSYCAEWSDLIDVLLAFGSSCP